MSSNDIAIKVENISKLYRIGIKRERHDNFAATIFDFIKSPLKNYQKYRSLYKFDDIKLDQIQKSKDLPSGIILAVNDVSFEVKKGEVLGIIGGNGAGKSTLLKILCKITDPTTGHAEIRGRVSSLLEVGTGFHPELTGRENVYLNGTILGMRKYEIVNKFDEIVDFSGVEKFIDTPVKRYSSGMRVRLAFSVAAHLDPEILIIDEVLAVGDIDFQKKCLNKMEDVSKSGRTVLFVSHNMPSIQNLCNRVILLENGKIIKDGDANHVVSYYINPKEKMMASKIWDSDKTAPGDHIVRLLSLKLETKSGVIIDTVDIRESIKIEMKYEVFVGGHILIPYFYFINQTGIPLFASLEQDSAWRGKNRKKGKYTSYTFIPGNFLAPGKIIVNFYIMDQREKTQNIQYKNKISFEVLDSYNGDSARGVYKGQLPGAVRPLFKWKTEFKLNPNVAKAGGLQSQGVKGEAVVGYREPLTTQELKSSGFPDL